MKSKFIQELDWRGLLKDYTPHTKTHFTDNEMVGGYIGFDPTAPSLHVGNLCAIMLLKHLQLAGHKPIILLGGFTGGIGDPAGKSTERKLLSDEVVTSNLLSLKEQFAKFLDFDCGANSAEFVNNKDWLEQISVKEFLREVGRYVPVNSMLAKDSVKSRLDNGLSFTEFTYQLFQAYDFYWLYANKNCKLQMGGSDQWGNIIAGFELIRKKLGDDAFALTTGLLTKTDGGKFGKSEEGNIWLDPTLTTPYKFYQFWVNVDDAQIGKLLRIFTLLSKAEIESLEANFSNDPNSLKRILAEHVTKRVHSEEILQKVQRASKLLYNNSVLSDFEATDESILQDIFQGLQQKEFSLGEYDFEQIDNLIAQTLNTSKGDIRRLISGNGISINKQKIYSSTMLVNSFKLLKDKYLLIQKGKNYSIVKFV